MSYCFDIGLFHDTKITVRHGGYGYQASWGSANKAVELLELALKETEKV